MSETINLLSELAIQSYKLFHADGNSNTARAKRQDLKFIVTFITANKIKNLTEFTAEHCRQFQAELLKSLAPATVARRYRTLKHMFNHFQKIYPTLPNPCRSVREPHVELSEPKCLTAEQLEALRSACTRISDRSFDQARARLIVEVGARCGLRSADMRAIAFGKVQAGFFESVPTKGRKFRHVSFPLSVKQALEDFLPHREEMLSRSLLYRCFSHEQRQEIPVLISRVSQGKTSFSLGAKTLYRIISDLGDLAGIPDMHPHRLVHTFTNDFLEAAGNNVVLTSQARGHSNVSTTMRYLKKSRGEIQSVMERMK